MTLPPFEAAVNAAEPGPHAIICNGTLMFMYPTYMEALDRATDLESVGDIVEIVPIALINMTVSFDLFCVVS